MARILMVVTAADHLKLKDGTSRPTGFWAEELVELHRGLLAAGHTVDIATPGGHRAPVDQGSLDLTTETGRDIQAYLESIAGILEHPLALSEVPVGTYDALVLPGGHGPMADLAHDTDLGRLLIDAIDRDAPIGVLCHGPAGLLSAIRPSGEFAFAGKRLTVFTDEEERIGGLGANSPYLVESSLTALGAIVSAGEPWSTTTVTDGRLVSGQNPQSSTATARQLVAVLAQR